MPKLTADRVPSYRLHKQSGQAIVTLCGRDLLLGPHGTRASREKYTRLIHEWEAAGRRLPVDQAVATVSMVIVAYWDHCTTYYGGASGHGERRSIKLARGILRRLYGPLRYFVYTSLQEAGVGNAERVSEKVAKAFGGTRIAGRARRTCASCGRLRRSPSTRRWKTRTRSPGSSRSCSESSSLRRGALGESG